jgi:hypothetical protein
MTNTEFDVDKCERCLNEADKKLLAETQEYLEDQGDHLFSEPLKNLIERINS